MSGEPFICVGGPFDGLTLPDKLAAGSVSFAVKMLAEPSGRRVIDGVEYVTFDSACHVYARESEESRRFVYLIPNDQAKVFHNAN